MTAEQQDELVLFLARHPEAGDVIPDSGGVRKLRWLAEGRGKRGGARVIYYFRDLSMPLVLFTVYAKNEKSDLSAKERKAPESLGGSHRGPVQETQEGPNMKKEKKSSAVKGAEQVLEFLGGAANGTRVTTVEFAAGDVRSIRRRLNLSQARFAREFGFAPATVRNWEQGRNQPDRATRILLTVIRRHPDIVRGVVKRVPAR